MISSTYFFLLSFNGNRRAHNISYHVFCLSSRFDAKIIGLVFNEFWWKMMGCVTADKRSFDLFQELDFFPFRNIQCEITKSHTNRERNSFWNTKWLKQIQNVDSILLFCWFERKIKFHFTFALNRATTNKITIRKTKQWTNAITLIATNLERFVIFIENIERMREKNNVKLVHFSSVKSHFETIHYKNNN